MSAVETPVAGDVPYVPAVREVPIYRRLGKSLSTGSLEQSFDGCAPQRGGVIQPALSFMAMVFRSFMFHKDRCMRIYAHRLAR